MANARTGSAAAWAAWKKFGAKAAYLPARDRNAPPVPLKNKIVYIIDYTYDPPIIKKLIKDNVRVTAIDHHFSQKEGNDADGKIFLRREPFRRGACVELFPSRQTGADACFVILKIGTFGSGKFRIRARC